MKKKGLIIGLIALVVLLAGGATAFLLVNKNSKTDINITKATESIVKDNVDVYNEFAMSRLNNVSYVATAKLNYDGSTSTTEVDSKGNTRGTQTIGGVTVVTTAIGNTVYTCQQDKPCTSETVEIANETDTANQIAKMMENMKSSAKFVGKVDCVSGKCAKWSVPSGELASYYILSEDGRLMSTTIEGEFGSETVYEYKDVPAIKAPAM